jgi:predicted Zn-dependent peptidase
MRSSALPIFLLILSACGAHEATFGPKKIEIPIKDTSPRSKNGVAIKREAPPSPLTSKDSPFPKTQRTTLPSGTDLVVAKAGALPIVQVRVLVRAGANYAQPGAAQICAEMLKDGGTRSMTSAQLLEKLETLGASLGVDTDMDRTVFSISVLKEKLDPALAILGEMIAAPRFDEGELKKLKARLTDDAEDNARTDGQWMALWVAHRELFSDKSPYAVYDLLPAAIAKITSQTIRDFHKRFYVAKNVELLLVGDVEQAGAEALAKKHFGALGAGEPPKVEFPAQIPPAKRRVVVVNRPKSAQSEVFVMSLGPERKAADWPEIRVANQVLGGGPASRLFGDVREQRSLAYSTNAQVIELAHGSQPLYAYAGTKTPSTFAAVQGLLENLDKMSSVPISETELSSARRFLSDIFAVRVETIGSIANLLAQQDALGLGDGYWDKYREAVRGVDSARAQGAAKKLFGSQKVVIVVAGDAEAIQSDLTKLGEVVVVDPAKDFATTTTLPAAK